MYDYWLASMFAFVPFIDLYVIGISLSSLIVEFFESY